MKRKSLLHYSLAILVIQFLFSCSSAEYYRFAPSQQETYKKVKEKPAPTIIPSEIAVAPALDAPEAVVAAKPEPSLEASVQALKRTLSVKNKVEAKALVPEKIIPTAPTELSAQEAEALAKVQTQLALLTKAQKKEIKTGIKGILQESASGTNILEIVLAVLLPPLAVFLHDGLNTRFWISLILTLLFWIPGVIYALLVVTDSI
ncbi:MAG: hydrogenase expression protein [Adhaeribacter sp.]|nr:hydrogenase expression protein [Adhaeribacter sp.]